MKRLVGFGMLYFLLLFPLCYAYIDPGTGGYLISALWQYVVALLVFVGGIIAHFFRYSLKNWFRGHHPVVRVTILVGICMGISVIVITFVNQPEYFEGDPRLEVYNESLNGVQLYIRDKAFDGYTLLDGQLLDMQGNLVQNFSFFYLSYIDSEGFYYGQREYEALEWGKFYLNNTPVWIKEMPIHHEIIESPSNTIFTFSKEVVPYNDRNVEFDVIIEFDKDGDELSRWSTWDAFTHLKEFHRMTELDKPAGEELADNHQKNISIWGGEYDYYHLNGLTFVPSNEFEGQHPAFSQGNWIISFRHGSMVFILDKDNQSVLWRAIDTQIEGQLQGQHSPFMQADGSVVIFDNGRYRNTSRILTINPFDLQIKRSYEPDDFYTYSQGYIQELPNGNWLVTESEAGRVFELTPEYERVWEYNWPYSVEKDWGLVRDDVYRAYRYDRSFIEKHLAPG